MVTPRKLFKKARKNAVWDKHARDAHDPFYIEWRKKVRARDNSTCQMPGCGSKKIIHVHHILRWAENPLLRYDVNNGICLCSKCHKSVTGQEEIWAAFFMSIVITNTRRQIEENAKKQTKVPTKTTKKRKKKQDEQNNSDS